MPLAVEVPNLVHEPARTAHGVNQDVRPVNEQEHNHATINHAQHGAAGVLIPAVLKSAVEVKELVAEHAVEDLALEIALKLHLATTLLVQLGIPGLIGPNVRLSAILVLPAEAEPVPRPVYVDQKERWTKLLTNKDQNHKLATLRHANTVQFLCSKVILLDLWMKSTQFLG